MPAMSTSLEEHSNGSYCAVPMQVAFRVKEGLAEQMLHYDVSVGAYMQLDDPRPLVQEALALLIPRATAEQVSVLLRCSAPPR